MIVEKTQPIRKAVFLESQIPLSTNRTYTSVFNVLEWLMEPVEGYLNNHAGYPASER